MEVLCPEKEHNPDKGMLYYVHFIYPTKYQEVVDVL